MLTKSLHTITAATNVAAYALANGHVPAKSFTASELAGYALLVLGYRDEAHAVANERAKNDPTVQRIVANCAKLLAERAK